MKQPDSIWFALGLGSNLPYGNLDGARLLGKALEAVEAAGHSCVVRSGFWASPAWPDPAAPSYTNAVAICAAASSTPEDVLHTLLQIEQLFGRERRTRWAARTLDLDLLDFAGQRLQTASLELPHPRLQERSFVLAPLAEAAPWWRHPISGEGALTLLQSCDTGGLRRIGD